MLTGEYLSYFDPNRTTQLITDASGVGLGAVLLQREGERTFIIAFASKTLTDLERRYSQVEREALGVIWGMEKFETFLYGIKFELYTDCKALQFLYSPQSKPSARILRWVLRAQCFDFSVKHLKGTLNIADPLSRLVSNTDDEEVAREQYIRSVILESRPVAISWDKIVEESSVDANIQKVVDALHDDDWSHLPTAYSALKDEFCDFNGILLRNDRIVIPTTLRQKILELAHEGHLGIRNMKLRLRSKVWWPAIDRDAEAFVRACKSCTMTSLPDPPIPIGPKEIPYIPWQAIHVDFKVKLPNEKNLFAVCDIFTRYIEYEVMTEMTTDKTIKALVQMFTRWGVPETIQSDNGPQFISREWKNFCKEYGINHVTAPPYWPQANGQIERQNQTFGKRVQAALQDGEDWELALAKYILAYHNLPHPITKAKPSERMLGRTTREKLNGLHDLRRAPEDDDRDVEKVNKAKTYAYTNQKRRARDSKIHEGDVVLIKNQRKTSKQDTNFGAGEHRVISRHGAEVVVEEIDTGKRKRQNLQHCKLRRDFTLAADNAATNNEVPGGSVPLPNELDELELQPQESHFDTADIESDPLHEEQEASVQTADDIASASTENSGRGKRLSKAPTHLRDFITY